jgi:hypothetical protein
MDTPVQENRDFRNGRWSSSPPDLRSRRQVGGSTPPPCSGVHQASCSISLEVQGPNDYYDY